MSRIGFGNVLFIRTAISSLTLDTKVVTNTFRFFCNAFSNDSRIKSSVFPQPATPVTYTAGSSHDRTCTCELLHGGCRKGGGDERVDEDEDEDGSKGDGGGTGDSTTFFARFLILGGIADATDELETLGVVEK
jgi:hypothetical protein